jgi:methyl-accepting chemotaxis protein
MKRFIPSLVAPGMRLMQRLPLRSKMVFMAACLLLPLALLLAGAFSDLSRALSATRAERAGVDVVRSLTGLLVPLQGFRAQTLQVMQGDAGSQAGRQLTRTRIASALSGVDASLAASEDEALHRSWRPLRERLSADVNNDSSSDRAIVLAEHSARIKELTAFIEFAAERSSLLLDPESATYFLMDIAVERLPQWLEDVSLASGVGAAILVRGEPSSKERITFAAHAESMSRHLATVKRKLDSLIRADGKLPAEWEYARAAGERLLLLTQETFAAEVPPVEAAAYLAAGTDSVLAIEKLDDAVLSALADELDRRILRLQSRLVTYFAASAIGVLAMAYLGIAFFHSQAAVLNQLMDGVRAMAEGDLSSDMRIGGRDEVARIGKHLNAMSGRLSSLVGSIRSSAMRVGHASRTVSAEGLALALRTETQADRLRESTAAIEQLSVSASSSAELAGSLGDTLDTLRSRTEEGSSLMVAAQSSMDGLIDSARRVAEINGVIDDIAFQTNLLALNAAVEAARAGESGKGFAVVAGEVRKLALRCTEAAADIRGLIARTNEQVATSAAQTREGGLTLGSIQSGVDQLCSRLASLATQSNEQSAKLKEVAQSVGSLDDITSENALGGARCTAASRAMEAQAARLRRSVESVQLRPGTRQEAKELVEAALRRVDEIGWTIACTEFNDVSGPYVDRDMHLFAIDRDGFCRVLATHPEWTGQRLEEACGAFQPMIREFVEAAWKGAVEGGSWIRYTDGWSSEGASPVAKTAFVTLLNEDLILGCGCVAGDDPACPDSTANPAAARADGAPGLTGRWSEPTASAA